MERTKKPRQMPGLLSPYAGRRSVLRNDRAAPAVVEADLAGVDAGVRIRVGEQHAGRSSQRGSRAGVALVGAEVEILALQAPVVVEGILDAGTNCVGNLGVAAAVDDQEAGTATGRARTDAGVVEAVGVIDEGDAALDIEQGVVGGPTGAAGEHTVPVAETGGVDAVDRRE